VSSSPDICEKLYEAIRVASTEEPGELRDSLRLIDDLGISSMTALMVLMDTAEEAGIPIADMELKELITVGDLVSCFSGLDA
jgi:acyl carrier protein